MLNMKQVTNKIAIKKGKGTPILPNVQYDEHITLLLFISAAGNWTKPLAIFPLETEPHLSEEVKDYFKITGQENGWIDGRIFKNSVENGFVEDMIKLRGDADKDEVVLLLTDGHASRGSLDAKKLWDEFKIMILILPPHSSALIQPLDLSVNGEFKGAFSNRLSLSNCNNKAEKRQKVMETALRCLTRVNNMDTIKNGWERTGLMPININAVLTSNMVKDETYFKKDNEPKQKRRRGQKITGGRIMYDGKAHELGLQQEIQK